MQAASHFSSHLIWEPATDTMCDHHKHARHVRSTPPDNRIASADCLVIQSPQREPNTATAMQTVKTETLRSRAHTMAAATVPPGRCLHVM